MNYSFKNVHLFFSNILDQVRASLSPASCINCELIIKKEGLCLECFKKIKPAISTVVSGLKRTIIPVYAAGIYEGVLEYAIKWSRKVVNTWGWFLSSKFFFTAASMAEIISLFRIVARSK